MRGNKEEDLEEVTMSDEEEEEEEAEICSLVALNLDNGVEVSKMSSNPAFLVKWYVRTVLKHLPNNHNSLSENIFSSK